MKSSIVPVRSFQNFDGHLSVIEQTEFPVKRVFWITSLRPDTHRGGHAHKNLHQFIVAVNGECKINSYSKDGSRAFFKLSSPYVGLNVPPGNWLNIFDFTRNTVLMVLASEQYETEDYINDPKEFFGGSPPADF